MPSPDHPCEINRLPLLSAGNLLLHPRPIICGKYFALSLTRACHCILRLPPSVCLPEHPSIHAPTAARAQLVITSNHVSSHPQYNLQAQRHCSAPILCGHARTVDNNIQSHKSSTAVRRTLATCKDPRCSSIFEHKRPNPKVEGITSQWATDPCKLLGPFFKNPPTLRILGPSHCADYMSLSLLHALLTDIGCN